MIDTLSEARRGTKAMSILPFLSGRGKLACAFALLSLLFSAPSAHANTFLYSFTTAQLLGALDAVDATHLQDGFFAIFLQAPTGSTISQVNSPDPNPGTNNDDWIGTTIVNAGLGSGTWVEFSRDYAAGKNVTLVSDANNGGTASNNIFLGQSYVGGTGSAPPLAFGTVSAMISDVMASNAVFSFVISGATISGTQSFTGAASAIDSSSSSTMSGTKTTFPNNFSITATGTALPEPATWIPLVSGLACLLAAGARKKRNRQ